MTTETATKVICEMMVHTRDCPPGDDWEPYVQVAKDGSVAGLYVTQPPTPWPVRCFNDLVDYDINVPIAWLPPLEYLIDASKVKAVKTKGNGFWVIGLVWKEEASCSVG